MSMIAPPTCPHCHREMSRAQKWDSERRDLGWQDLGSWFCSTYACSHVIKDFTPQEPPC